MRKRMTARNFDIVYSKTMICLSIMSERMNVAQPDQRAFLIVPEPMKVDMEDISSRGRMSAASC